LAEYEIPIGSEPVLKLSVYWGGPEVIGAQTERRDCTKRRRYLARPMIAVKRLKSRKPSQRQKEGW
jgi:hypothetical protein